MGNEILVIPSSASPGSHQNKDAAQLGKIIKIILLSNGGFFR